MQIEGYAEFKSHILRRDEKGMFGVPFKRLLFSGLGGGMVTTICKIPLPDASVPLGIISTIALVFLTAPRGGIPRWKHIVYAWRWRLMTAALTTPNSVLGSIGLMFQLPTSGLDLDGDSLFKPSEDSAPRTELTDWVSFLRLNDADDLDGMTFNKSPGLSLDEE